MKGYSWVLRAVVAAGLCLTLILAGCSTNWIEEAEQIVAALIPAATNIVTLVAGLEGKGVSASDAQLVQSAGAQAGADLQLISGLIAAYQKADESARPGILNQIQSGIEAVEANLQGLLGALHIQDAATQAKITAVVGIVLSEVQGLAAVLPAGGSSHFSQKQREVGHPTSLGQPTVSGGKTPLSAREFVKSYNATMRAKTGKVELDRATAGLGIHEHGKVERIATVGVLK